MKVGQQLHDDRGGAVYLERVMNSFRNGLGMRKTSIYGRPSQPENPHSNAIFTQVHNTL